MVDRALRGKKEMQDRKVFRGRLGLEAKLVKGAMPVHLDQEDTQGLLVLLVNQERKEFVV